MKERLKRNRSNEHRCGDASESMNSGHTCNAKLDELSKSAVDGKHQWCSIKEEKYTYYRPIHIPFIEKGGSVGEASRFVRTIWNMSEPNL